LDVNILHARFIRFFLQLSLKIQAIRMENNPALLHTLIALFVSFIPRCFSLPRRSRIILKCENRKYTMNMEKLQVFFSRAGQDGKRSG